VITEGDLVVLARGTLRFPCRHSLWTLLHEILLNEDYYFDCQSEAPVIIDGGAHMGMAIYYFKTRYPGARSTAFEPDPALQALAVENVARNGWEGVEILPCALAGSRCDATFHVSEAWSMAGSLSERRSRLGDVVTTITVPCVPLSEYLHGPVDFLKLDIEGAELEVLEETAPWLPNVGHIVCEVHQGGGENSGALSRILALLEAADFEVQVGKSHNYQVTSRWRPFSHFDGAASLMVWARNRR
jgi:FkbM family methyltransferase